MPGFRQLLLPACVGTLASLAPGILICTGILILAIGLLAREVPVEAASTDSIRPKTRPALAAVLPAWPAYQLGETRTFKAQVSFKGGSHRLGACKTRIELDTEGLFSRWSLCLPEAQWAPLQRGDAVVVTSASSWLGDYVLHVGRQASLHGDGAGVANSVNYGK